MASIAADPNHREAEAAGERTLELVAVRYTGDNTSLAVSNHLNNQGGWPRMTPLQGRDDGPGPWYYALVPDDGLGHLENRPDVEVLYGTDRERFAKALLDERRLPQNAFGTGADSDLRERVFNVLGLKPEVKGGRIRDQLRDIADIEPDEDEEEEDLSLVKTLVDVYSRKELGEACKELREDADEFNLQENQEKTERAEFIAQFDDDERTAALPDKDSDSGGDD